MESEKVSNNGHIATAAEFRARAEARALAEFEEPEPVTLPESKLTVMLRRPRPAYFWTMGLPMPSRLLDRSKREADESAVASSMTRPELAELTEKLLRLYAAAFVEPRLSLNPGPNEISPNWLEQGDIVFLVRYLVGEVLAGGQDLAAFRGETARPADAGAGGGNMGVQTIGAAGEPDAAVADRRDGGGGAVAVETGASSAVPVQWLG